MLWSRERHQTKKLKKIFYLTSELVPDNRTSVMRELKLNSSQLLNVSNSRYKDKWKEVVAESTVDLHLRSSSLEQTIACCLTNY